MKPLAQAIAVCGCIAGSIFCAMHGLNTGAFFLGLGAAALIMDLL